MRCINFLPVAVQSQGSHGRNPRRRNKDIEINTIFLIDDFDTHHFNYFDEFINSHNWTKDHELSHSFLSLRSHLNLVTLNLRVTCVVCGVRCERRKMPSITVRLARMKYLLDSVRELSSEHGVSFVGQ